MRLHEITHADLPPALLTLLNPERLPTCFATVIIGGEVCPPATVRRWAAYCRVVNVYGPTEATICTSTVVCRTTWVDSDIGTPVPGIRYRVVDDQGQPMTSPGQGELWIGGDGLASGYVGQPALARSPFLVVDNERWYRTGDLVELIDDGSLCFRGRLDRQFKVHGVLVQPEEIEAALCACPGVSAAFAGKAAAGGGQLHAWVTGENLHRETLLQLLSDKLPMHLLPAALHLHPEFSLTTTGKIDGKALIDGSEAPAGAAAASDPMQSTLQRVWADVLDIPLPAPQAVLSVDSLAAMHACVQLADAGIDSMPNHLMLPTIAAQASALAIAGYEVNTIATETLCSRVNDMPRPPQLQVPTEETPT